MVIVGYLSYYLFVFVGWLVLFIYCLLFGVLISLIDLIVVLVIIK